MVIRMKLKTMKDVSAADARNRYEFILARQHNNIFLQSERKMHDMITQCIIFIDRDQKVRHRTQIETYLDM